MKYVSRYITAPYRWYYGDDKVAITENINTNYCGQSLFYYKIGDHILFHQLKRLNEVNNSNITKNTNPFKTLFGSSDSDEENFVGISNQVVQVVANIAYIESVMKNSPYINHGAITGFEIDRGRNDDLSMGIFYGIKWSFELDINTNTNEGLPTTPTIPTIPTIPMNQITKNKKKIDMYNKIDEQYQKLINDAISFRSKYHNILGSNTINTYDGGFMTELVSLYKDLIKHTILKTQFRESLSWWENKKYEDHIKSKIESPEYNLPTLSINIDWKYECLYSV